MVSSSSTATNGKNFFNRGFSKIELSCQNLRLYILYLIVLIGYELLGNDCYTINNATDIPGGDIISMSYINSILDCILECHNKANCTAYSYVPSTNDCYLKHGVSSLESNVLIVSGLFYRNKSSCLMTSTTTQVSTQFGTTCCTLHFLSPASSTTGLRTQLGEETGV